MLRVPKNVRRQVVLRGKLPGISPGPMSNALCVLRRLQRSANTMLADDETFHVSPVRAAVQTPRIETRLCDLH